MTIYADIFLNLLNLVLLLNFTTNSGVEILAENKSINCPYNGRISATRVG